MATVRRRGARRSLANICGADISACREERLEAGRSPITFNNELIVISRLFNTARREWGMESLHDPLSNVRKPRPPPGRIRRLAGDEARRLLEHAEYPMHGPIVFALETGVSPGELLALTWPGVDLERCIFTLSDRCFQPLGRCACADGCLSWGFFECRWLMLLVLTDGFSIHGRGYVHGSTAAVPAEQRLCHASQTRERVA